MKLGVLYMFAKHHPMYVFITNDAGYNSGGCSVDRNLSVYSRHSDQITISTLKKKIYKLRGEEIVVIMQVLKRSFKILEVFGFWRPLEWHGWKKWLYNIYTTVIIFIPYSIILTQLIELPKYVDNFEKFIHNSLILLTQMNACAQVTNICRKRKEIRKAFNILMEKSCCTRNDEEEKIQKHFENIVKWNSLIYGGIIEYTVIVFVVSSIFKDTAQRQFIYDTWLPFHSKSEGTYWTVYIYQLVAVVISAFINLSYEILMAGCMLQICAQLDILKYRMKSLYRIKTDYYQYYCILGPHETDRVNVIEKKIVADYVQHHLKIFKFAKLTNKMFGYTIFLQYSISSIVICNSAYRLTWLAPFSPEFLGLTGYLICMLMQIYILCYYGNVVICKSANIRDEIYEMDWMALNISTKRSLLIMMMRTSRPIKFKLGHIVVLSLKSFNRLINLSYSVYNVLKHTS